MAKQRFKEKEFFLFCFVLTLSPHSLLVLSSSYIIFLSFGFLLFGFSETSWPLTLSLSAVLTAVPWLLEPCWILSVGEKFACWLDGEWRSKHWRCFHNSDLSFPSFPLPRLALTWWANLPGDWHSFPLMSPFRLGFPNWAGDIMVLTLLCQ